MAVIAIDKAETDLAALIKRARDGDEPGVKLALVEVSKTSYRGRGILKGVIDVSDADLFGPLPEDELKRWYGEGE